MVFEYLVGHQFTDSDIAQYLIPGHQLVFMLNSFANMGMLRGAPFFDGF